MKLLAILLFIPFLGRGQCEETFKRTLSLHYAFTPGAKLGGGFEGGLIGDISALSVSVGGDVSVFDSSRIKYQEGIRYREDINLRIYTKLMYRLVRVNYRFTLNAGVLTGFDNDGAVVQPGLRLLMPAGYNFAISLEPYYSIRDNTYLIHMAIHYKFP
jgi:hypothetical protein